MYEAFYQLSADPFRLSPDPEFSFQHRTYRKALTYMLHALQRAEGFIMITGQPGTGKTTLVSDLVSTLRSDQIAVAKIVSAQLTANDLLDLVAYSFNLDPEGCSKAKVLFQIEDFLKHEHQQGRRSLLIIDEAQGMGPEALEEVRLLTNIMDGNRQLLQIFLVGQEELQDTVKSNSLKQLHQRLIAATHLEPLDADDTRAYIKHRLRCVNWKGDPLISTETYDQIQRYSHGIPRQINQICSRLFLHGSIEEKHRLGIADIKIVVDELQQELLLPMDNEGIYETALWPAEQFEETYEEEPQTSTPAPKIVGPATATLPGIERAGQKPSTLVTDTGRHTPDRIRKVSRPAVWSGAVLVLIAAILAAYFIEGDSDQSVPDQDVLALNQAGTQQPVPSASEDTEVTSIQPRPETPAPEELASSDIRGSASEAGSKAGVRKNILVTPDIKTRQTPSSDATIDAAAEQRKPSLDEPVPAQETAPVIALLQGSQAKQAASPLPVKRPAVAPPLSEEEKIAELLAHGLRSLKSYRLLTPTDDNAYLYFQQVLKLDPGNSDALHGIEQVVARYTALATSALDQNDKEKAGQYITRGFLISPNDAGLLALRDRMNSPLFNPPVISAPEPEPQPENILMRFKGFFTQPPNKKIENQTLTDE
jgi:putative secretion ATPase (PEP-CTERM system associated)